MADSKIQYGTQLLFADHATDFGAAPATAANSLVVGTPVDVQMDLTSLAASGGGHQSAKTADLGVSRDHLFRVDACIEFAVAPTDGNTVDFYWASSPSATAGTGNPTDITGTDAAYVDTSGLLSQLTYIGSLSCSADTVVIGEVGIFTPFHRYGSLVVINNAAQAFGAAMDETHISVMPIISTTE